MLTLDFITFLLLCATAIMVYCHKTMYYEYNECGSNISSPLLYCKSPCTMLLDPTCHIGVESTGSLPYCMELRSQLRHRALSAFLNRSLQWRSIFLQVKIVKNFLLSLVAFERISRHSYVKLAVINSYAVSLYSCIHLTFHISLNLNWVMLFSR